MDKYVGFSAVESICEDDNSEVIVLQESGTLGWASAKAPQKVMINMHGVSLKMGRYLKLSIHKPHKYREVDCEL